MKRLVVLTIVVGLVVAAAVAATFGSTAPSRGVAQAKLPAKPKASPLPAAVKSRGGKWQIGVKCDTPPFGWQDPERQERGYDVEVARQFAKWAFGSASKVDFTCVTTASRIGTLTSGRVDIIISTLTWKPASTWFSWSCLIINVCSGRMSAKLVIVTRLPNIPSNACHTTCSAVPARRPSAALTFEMSTACLHS